MTTIKNNTPKPLKVPLPQGKRLFLGPHKSGQVDAKAILHPPVAALIESGGIEVVDEKSGPDRRGSSEPKISGGSAPNQSKEVFRAGDG